MKIMEMNKKILREVQEYLIHNGSNKIYPENLIAFADFVEKDREKQLFLFGVGSSTCKKHKPMNKELGCVGWYEWADRKTKQEHIQRKCPNCGKYLFKCEM